MLITGCYHRFGRKCLADYLDSESPRNNSCPQCRREWYKRPPAWTAPRDVNVTESLLGLTLPQEPALVESRARAHRTRNILEQERASNNGVISSHLDEIFRRLDMIQDISSEQHTSTADTRVRLQAIERRSRRLHQEFQSAHENSRVLQTSLNEREALLRRRERELEQRESEIRRQDRVTRELDFLRRMDLGRRLGPGLCDAQYPMASSANTRVTSSPTVPTPDESPDTVNASANAREDAHQPPASPQSEDPISARQYNAYLQHISLSNDNPPIIPENRESSTPGMPVTLTERDEPVASRDDVWTRSYELINRPHRRFHGIDHTEAFGRMASALENYCERLNPGSTQPATAPTSMPPPVSLRQPRLRTSPDSVPNRHEVPVDAGPFVSLDPRRNAGYWPTRLN